MAFCLRYAIWQTVVFHSCLRRLSETGKVSSVALVEVPMPPLRDTFLPTLFDRHQELAVGLWVMAMVRENSPAEV